MVSSLTAANTVTPSEMDLARPSTWQLIGHIEATIGARIAQQAGRYADLRTADYELPAPTEPVKVGYPYYGPGQPVPALAVRPIALHGQRLRSRFGVGRIIGVALAVSIAFISLLFVLLVAIGFLVR